MGHNTANITRILEQEYGDYMHCAQVKRNLEERLHKSEKTQEHCLKEQEDVQKRIVGFPYHIIFAAPAIGAFATGFYKALSLTISHFTNGADKSFAPTEDQTIFGAVAWGAYSLYLLFDRMHCAIRDKNLTQRIDYLAKEQGSLNNELKEFK